MGRMTYDLFKKIIDDAEGKVEFISLASRGEPFACKDIEKMLNEKVPLKKFGTPEDIGNMVAFLLSPRASFITGANFVVDGGQSIYLN